jgi:hypothetical protein
VTYEVPLDRAGLLGDLRDAEQAVGEAAALLRDLGRDAAGELAQYRDQLAALRDRARSLAEDLEALRRRIISVPCPPAGSGAGAKILFRRGQRD